MKKLIYFASICLIAWSCSNLAVEDTGIYDVRSVEVLDSLSTKIGNLESVSYTLDVQIEDHNTEGNLIEIDNVNDVYMRGPNKMHVLTKGTRGQKGYWYNDSTFSYYSYTNNTYDKVDAPESILLVIDALHTKFGIDFPAADFFYPSLTDDVLANFNKLLYWGETQVDDRNLHTISAYNKNTTVQIWVDSETLLPAKMVIFGEGEKKGHRYEASFSNWKLNPALPDVLFEFKAPKGATKTSLQPIK